VVFRRNMDFIITGDIGTGKSTVCNKLIEIMQNQGYSCGGIITYKNGIDIIIESLQSGETEILASSSDVYDGPSTPKYSFNTRGINFGRQEIENGIDSSFLVVDEIGRLELEGEGFTNVAELIRLKRINNCILVIRRELLSACLSLLSTEPYIFETKLDNRDQLPRVIGDYIFEKLGHIPDSHRWN